MNLIDENRALLRLLGRCEYLLKCRRRGPPRRGRPPLAEPSTCRTRMDNDGGRRRWCEICRLLADIEGFGK